MEKSMKNMTKVHLPVAACALLLLVASSAQAADPADARFKGTGKADPIRITNVSCKPSDANGAGTITFDLAWDGSWRAAWEVSPEQSGGQGPLTVENWDAAWVFVKFRAPGTERWSHATLTTNSADYSAPEGAKLAPGLTDDGGRGLGVFVYRSAAGSGPNNWKGLTLRWAYGADGVRAVDKVVVASQSVLAPKRAAARAPSLDNSSDGDDDPTVSTLVNVLADSKRKADAASKADAVEILLCAIPMVYVPEGAFWVGDGTTNAVVGQFSAGNTIAPFRIGSEHGVVLGGADKGNIGNRNRLNCADDFSVGQMRWLPPKFPKGFAAFYCMKHEITQGQMVEFLNTLGSDQQSGFMELSGAGKNGIRVAHNGPPAVFATDTPHVPCAGMMWNEGTAYAAWAGLRPITELEFEKACRGPLKPVPDEYAWGTAAIAGSNSKEPPRDGYALRNAGTPDETVVWQGANGPFDGTQGKPDAARGNAAWIGTIVGVPLNQWGVGYAVNDISRPLRVGIFSTPDSGRVAAGASYWGITELSGNLCEYAVTVGNTMGRRFAGVHGDGSLAQPTGWYALAKSLRVRGGGINAHGAMWQQYLRVSDRRLPGLAGMPRSPMSFVGFRAVRSAVVPPVPPAGPATQPPPGSDDEDASYLFNAKLRIENLTLAPRDAKSALIRFDITWDDSWRNATNHDAAWVFFKMQPAGSTTWQHVKLVSDKVLNPTGYGHESGTKLEFVVPDGKDGFTGVFLQRSTPGTGPVSAKGVTVVCDTPSPTPDIRAFGVEMVYVPEGPFSLGSGGTEETRFYQYTDGSQNRLPYRVADAGPVPTGPQAGRLWATGQQPDGTDAGELPATFPNGYQAFYCMKHCIMQGQFAGFLGMQSEVKSEVLSFRGGNWPVLYRHVSGGSSLTWGMGAAFAAWAGLRPMTELEYEKACRGSRDPQPNEAGPSVWGIRNLNVGEMITFVVSAANPAGRSFSGTHGSGIPGLPADWPGLNARGATKRGAPLSAGAEPYTGAFDLLRISFRQGPASDNEGESTGVDGRFRGWRGVRTVPNLKPAPTAGEKKAAENFKLEIDPLPSLGDADIAVFYLAGRFHNGSDEPVQAEVSTPLPDACFPEGAASRTFTAASKSATPFKVLTVVTRRTVQNARRVQLLPVRIKKAGGAVLDETQAKLQLTDPMAIKPSVIGNLAGGTLAFRMINPTSKPAAFTIELQPPAGMALAESSRKVELANGDAPVETKFGVTLPDASLLEGFYPIAYRLVSAGGAAQTGEVVVEVRAQSRWWVEQSAFKAGATMDADDDLSENPDLANAGIVSAKDKPEEKAWNADPAGVFEAAAPAKGWQAVSHGASLWVRQLKPAPQPKAILSAATRVFAKADQEAVLKMAFETDCWTWLDGAIVASIDFGVGQGFYPPPTKVWVNGDLVRDSRTAGKNVYKTVPLKKGINTVLMRFEAVPDARGQFPHVFPLFYDAKTGARIENLVFDMEKKP
jgi:formylglycine-generating enzyme required for sulfatase activity